MIELDPRRTALAREFRARPFGVHSGDLQVVLNRMRSETIPGKYALFKGYDNNVARLTTNVLRRCLDPAPLPMPTGG